MWGVACCSELPPLLLCVILCLKLEEKLFHDETPMTDKNVHPQGWTPFLKKNMWKCTFDIPSGDKLGFYYKKYFLPEGQYMWLLQCIVVISLDEQSYIYKYTVQCMDTTLEWITSSTVAMGAARDTRTCVWTSLCIAKDAWARILQPTWTEQTYLWRIQIIFFSIPSVDIKPIKDCPSSCWLLKLVFFLLIIF